MDSVSVSQHTKYLLMAVTCENHYGKDYLDCSKSLTGVTSVNHSCFIFGQSNGVSHLMLTLKKNEGKFRIY